jgi:hypothetical protein
MFEVRDGLFLYWWKCSPSKFKLSFHVIVAKDMLSLSKYKLFLLSILSFEKMKLFVDFSNIYGA